MQYIPLLDEHQKPTTRGLCRYFHIKVMKQNARTTMLTNYIHMYIKTSKEQYETKL